MFGLYFRCFVEKGIISLMPIFLWNLIFITRMQWVLTLLPPDQECWQHSSKEINIQMLPTLLVRLLVVIHNYIYSSLLEWICYLLLTLHAFEGNFRKNRVIGHRQKKKFTQLWLLLPANRAGPVLPESPFHFLLTSPGHNSNKTNLGKFFFLPMPY